MYSQKVLLATLGLVCLSGCVIAGVQQSYAYNSAPVYDAVNEQPQYAQPQETAEAAASAITNTAAAKAAASKIDSINLPAIQKYGYEIAVPLLVKPHGEMTSLYSALGPKRAFVADMGPAFYKDSYGNIKFRDETSVAAIAI